MLPVRPYTHADRPAWDRFVLDREGSHPAQLSTWLELTARTYGVAHRAFMVEEAGAVRGVLPLFEKRRLGRVTAWFSAAGGLLAADENAAAALLERVAALRRDTGAAYVELRDQRQQWSDLATSTEHCTHILALQSDAAAQWRAFDAKLRNQIRKAERAGFSAHWGGAQLGGFYRVFLENMRDLGTPIRAERWFRALLDALGERAALLVIRRNGEPVGGMFLVVHRGWFMDIWASSLRRHFADCPNQWLYWEALQEALRRGLHGFDFGRSQHGTGTYRFKEQWGAQEVPLYYQYLRAPAAVVPSFAAQRQRLGLATTLWKRLPLPLARRLGEPIRRRFPELV